MKRGSIIGVALVALVGILASASLANILPNGLMLVSFEVKVPQPAIVGQNVEVEFILKNLSPEPITFHQDFGVFVGTRREVGSESENRDFGHAHKGKTISQEESLTLKATTKLDAPGLWRFWPAFNINGFWGPYRWMEKVVEVYSSPEEAAEKNKPLTVAEILNDPNKYDQRRVIVIGEAFIVRHKTDRKGRPWTLISLVDLKERTKVMNVFCWGHAQASNADTVKVTGIFKVKSKRGRLTFDNEIDALEGQVEVIKKAEPLNQ